MSGPPSSGKSIRAPHHSASMAAMVGRVHLAEVLSYRGQSAGGAMAPARSNNHPVPPTIMRDYLPGHIV